MGFFPICVFYQLVLVQPLEYLPKYSLPASFTLQRWHISRLKYILSLIITKPVGLFCLQGIDLVLTNKSTCSSDKSSFQGAVLQPDVGAPDVGHLLLHGHRGNLDPQGVPRVGFVSGCASSIGFGTANTK